MNNYTVYMHISPSNKRYIGITSQTVEKRWNNGHGYRNNKHFTNAINHYGWENFQHIIITRGLTEDEAKWLEIELIREWDSSNRDKGYNISLGGDITSEETRRKISVANKGKTFSEEHRKKLSEAKKEKYCGENNPNYGKGLKGENHPMYGKQHTEEARKKMREKAIGRPSPNKGKFLSEESKKKLSETRNGKNNPRAKNIICITTNMVFSTIKEGAEYYKTDRSAIAKCCKGKLNYSGKYNGTPLAWRYIEIIEL